MILSDGNAAYADASILPRPRLLCGQSLTPSSLEILIGKAEQKYRYGMIWGFREMGVPKSGWFMMDNPIRFGCFGDTPILGNLHIERYQTLMCFVSVQSVPTWADGTLQMKNC